MLPKLQSAKFCNYSIGENLSKLPLKIVIIITVVITGDICLKNEELIVTKPTLQIKTPACSEALPQISSYARVKTQRISINNYSNQSQYIPEIKVSYLTQYDTNIALASNTLINLLPLCSQGSSLTVTINSLVKYLVYLDRKKLAPHWLSNIKTWKAEVIQQINSHLRIMVIVFLAIFFIIKEISFLVHRWWIKYSRFFGLPKSKILVGESRNRLFHQCIPEDDSLINYTGERFTSQQKSPVLADSDELTSLQIGLSDSTVIFEDLRVPIYDATGRIAFAIANFADISQCQGVEQLLTAYHQVLETHIDQRTEDLRSLLEQMRHSQEMADAANLAKSEFIANMSHELRTPLTAILGFTQMMSQDYSLSLEHQQNLAIINRAGEHLLNLINDILEISKIEVGRTTLNLSKFDLIRLLGNLQEMLQARAAAKNLQFQFEYPAHLPQYIQTDESKLRQVLINLLSNAIKFTEVGSVTLRVRLQETGCQRIHPISYREPDCHPHQHGNSTANTQCLIFEIQDTGIGISPEEINLLFEAFGQTESGRKSQQGTGLGLAISRKYVQLMGGDITVNSTLGAGSTFTFNIQVSLVPDAEILLKPTLVPVNVVAAGQREYRILVVDDVADSRLLLVKLLSSVGFLVREAENGEKAIFEWQQWHPQLILMDMQMPIINGYEATRLIRSYEQGDLLHRITRETMPPTRTTIIALTAHAFAEQRQAMLEAGCDDYICKPFLQELLLNKIQQYLGVQYISPEQVGTNRRLDSQTAISLSETDVLFYLSQMPTDLRENIYYAAASCSDELILELIKQIPTEKNPIYQFFQDLAHNYQFEKIMALTKTNPE